MNSFPMWMGLLAGVPTIMAYVRLAKILNKPSTTIRPNLASWLPWLAVDASVFAASIAQHVVTTMVVFGVFTLGTITVLIIVIRKKAMMKFGLVDGASLVVSGLALVAWWLTGDAKLALYINVVVVVVATIPSIINAWDKPETQDLRVWSYFLAGGFINLFAVVEWDMKNGLVPVSVVVVQAALVLATARDHFASRSTYM